MILERTFGGTVEDFLAGNGAENPRTASLTASRILYESAFDSYQRMLDEVKRNFRLTTFWGKEMIKNSADALRDMWERNPQEEGIVYVRVSDEEKLRVEVEDNGLGLSEEAKAHLFQREFTTKDRSYIGGCGVGMFKARSKIVGFKGDMGYIEKDRGVIFWYELGLHLGDELNNELKF